MEKQKMKKIFAFAALLLAAGCTNAGPFVTNISSDGDRGLIIEKCQLHMNAFMGTVSNENCTNTQIKVK